MKRPYPTALRAAAVTAAGTLAVMAGMPAAVADEGDVSVVNTETVQVYADAVGAVQTKRIYEQLAFTGDGTVDLRNPIATDGLRNLDGFGGFEVENGEQVANVTVDGEERLRTVSDYDGDLPLEISVEYFLDGEAVEPGDVVGESGELEVQYTVKNVTAAPQEISFPDGTGGTITKTVDVPIPLVGSLTTTAPKNFTDVESGQANMAGDGKGGTTLSFTMTLFPPIGSDTAEFGYTANISDGVIPRASATVLPVNPLESPSFKSAGESYQGGADTGIELAEGAAEIDANLLKLRDGAGELLAGLIQLRDGAVELEAGLSGVAAPGAARLADGATELGSGINQIDDGAGQLAAGASELDAGAGRLADGTGRLDAGAGELADGTGRLADGTGAAFTGSQQLSDGLGRISGGLGQLADAQSGLPAAAEGITQLQDGVDLIIANLGTVDDPATLIGGLAKLEAGLGQLKAGSGQLEGGLKQLAAGLPAAKGGVDQVKAGLDASLAEGGGLDQLDGGLSLLELFFCPQYLALGGPDAPPERGGFSCAALVTKMQEGAADSRGNLELASGGLGQVSAGLATAITGLNTQLIPGAGQLTAGIAEAEAGSTQLKNGAIQLKGGMQQLDAGIAQLADGITSAVAGVLQLSSGADEAYVGSQDLSGGLGQLDAGAAELNAGAGQLAAGTGELDAGAGALVDGTGRLEAGAGELAAGTGRAADGANQVADGANQLATGLGDAADGSGLLADGLGQAAGSAPALGEGAQRLSDEGTSKLVEAGESTAQNYGELYAMIATGAERAQTEKMVFGAPEGATGMAAYSFVLQGEDGEGGRNLARGLGGLALLGAGGAAFALRRRLI